MIKSIISLCFLVTVTLVTAAQSTNRETAMAKKSKAIQLMDDGKIEASIALLEEAIKLDPDEPSYTYEIGYAKYLSKDYEGAIEIMKKLINREYRFSGVYQLMGNCYDLAGKPDQAVDAYEKGLKEFPAEGKFYMQLGVMQLNAKNNDKAIGYFERGVKAAPKYPSNYYWLSKVFCSTTSGGMWGMLYGEIFMNIERATERTEEISELLYLTYKSNIQFRYAVLYVYFGKLDEGTADQKAKSYGMNVYNSLITSAATPEKEIDLASLNRIRSGFLQEYYQKGHAKKYPNPLFEFQQKVKQNGHLEAYNQWILQMGNLEAHLAWTVANETKMEDFINWFNKNPLELTPENKFHREQYL